MRVLVVEDNNSHMDDAVKILQAAGIQVARAYDEGTAKSRMIKYDGKEKVPQVDGVITDIFLPHSEQHPWNHSDDPCGLGVALYAEQHGIPFVMCTAGYHHGSRYNWICQIGRSRGWPEVVDSTSDYHSEAQTKNWAEALKRLKEIITKKQQSVT